MVMQRKDSYNMAKHRKNTRKRNPSRRAGTSAVKTKTRSLAARRGAAPEPRLPGMEQRKYKRLEEACVQFANGSALIKEGGALQAGAKQTALVELKNRELTSYRAAGIVFGLQHGQDTVTVRKAGPADEATAPPENGDTTDDIPLAGADVDELHEESLEDA